MDRVSFFFLRLLIGVISILPFWAIYLLSDFFYVLCFHVVRYRRKVVYSNLRSSFPEMSEDDIYEVSKKSYHWFCDIILECVKTSSMTVDDFNKRMRYENMELLRNYVDSGKSVFLDMAHTGNWEWVPNIYLSYFKDIVGAELYRHVKNKYLDNYLLEVRRSFKTLVIPKDKAIRPLAKIHQEGKVFALGLLADQTPSRSNLHFWTQFLNHDTPFLQGPERLARMFKSAVVYLDFRREKRGYYVCTFRDITADASLTEEGFVTTRYAQLLEETIKRDPAIWFWTHRRWKYDHQQIMEEDKKKQSK